MNTVSLIGRMTKSPQLKQLSEGRIQTSFVIAVNKGYKQDEADFVLCTIWGKIAETTVKYCGKGSLVGITGRLNTRSYEKGDGTRVFITEVIVEEIRFLITKKREEGPEDKSTSNFEFPIPNKVPV